MPARYVLFLFLCLSRILVYAQPNQYDTTGLKAIIDTGSAKDKAIALWHFAFALTEKQPPRSLHYYKKALELAREAQADTVVNNIRSNLALFYSEQGLMKQALHYREQVDTSLFNKKPGNITLFYYYSGIIYSRVGLQDSAMYFFEKSLEMAKQGGDSLKQAASYNGIANIALNKLDFEKALQGYKHTYEIMSVLGNRHGEAIALDNMGSVNRDMGNNMAALGYYHKAIALNKSINFYTHLSANYLNSSIAYTYMDSLDNAEKYALEGLRICQANQVVRSLPKLHNRLGEIYLQKKDYAKAIRHTMSSLKISKEKNIRQGLLVNYLLLSQIYHKKSTFGLALQYADSAKQNLPPNSQDNIRAKLYKSYYRIYKSAGNLEKALAYYESYNQIAGSLDSLTQNKQVQRLQVEMNTLVKEKENQLLEKENQLQSARLRQQRLYNSWVTIGLALALLTAIVFVVLIKKLRQNIRKREKQHRMITRQTKELRKANQEIEKHAQYREAMSRMMVHDLKNPLNLILSYADMTNKSRAIEIIKPYGKQMLHLVRNILDVYKYDYTRPQLSRTSFFLYEIAEEAFQEMAYFGKSRNITFRNAVPTGYAVHADRVLILRVFVNLVGNAVNYAGSATWVSIGAEDTGHGQIAIKVADNGDGISPEKQEKLFRPLSHTGEQQQSGFLSSGIGLVFCKIATEAHGSAIRVESPPGQGAAFHFTLPRGKQPAPHRAAHPTENTENENLPLLSADDKQHLRPLALELQGQPLYKITAIRNILKKHSTSLPQNEAVALWFEDLQNAIIQGMEIRYNALLAVVGDGDTPNT